MSKEALYEIIGCLPYNIRIEINGYVDSIENVSAEIFESAGIGYNEGLLESLLLLAGIRRIYSMVDSQFWILDNSLSLVRQQEVRKIRIGSSSYGYDSEEYTEIRELKNELEALITQLGILKYIKATSLSEILVLLGEE